MIFDLLFNFFEKQLQIYFILFGFYLQFFSKIALNNVSFILFILFYLEVREEISDKVDWVSDCLKNYILIIEIEQREGRTSFGQHLLYFLFRL